MFARVTTAAVRRDGFEAALDLFETTTIPIVRALPGQRGALSFGNRAENRVITLTLWDTEEARRASGMDQAVIDNVAEFGPYVVGSFSRDQYDVVVDTWGPQRASHPPNTGFARATTTLLRLDCWAEGVALVREITSRPAGAPPAYRGSLAMVDPLTGKVLVLEVWDTRAALAAYDTYVSLHDRIARSSQLLVSAPVHAIYRVSSNSAAG